MKIVLTGKSGVGKTTILDALGYQNIFISDQYVKDVLYSPKHEVFLFIKKEFSEAVIENKIRYDLLGKILFNNKLMMEKINTYIYPFIKKWIHSLPKNSIVEMASYIELENTYKDLFDYVILITNDIPNTSKKFEYMKKDFQPISDKNIHFDLKLENKDINETITTIKENIFWL